MTDQGMDLEDVLFAFAAEPIHNRETLESYLDRFPAFADELLELSLDMSLMEANGKMSVAADEEWVEASAQALRSVIDAARSQVADPFARTSKAELKALRERLRVPSGVIEGFRNRLVDLTTIPHWVLGVIAEGIRSSFPDLQSFLLGQPRLSTSIRYKADGAPSAPGAKITFDKLLEDNLVPDERRQELLAEGE